MRRNVFALSVFVLLTGCMVGPKYERPKVPAPPQFRADPATAPAPESLGDAKWFDIFQDEKLQALIREAITANFDVQISAQRILQAEGRLTATRSSLFPQFGLQGFGSRQGTSNPVTSSAGGFAVASWELDLFGRIRSATAAARADLAVTKEDRLAILQTLVAQVASGYFDLRQYDAELFSTIESIKKRNASLDLVTARFKGGVSNRLDFDQAKSLVESALATKAQLEQAIQQTENLLSFLLGRPPGPIERGISLQEQYQPPTIPAGIPSSLLDRRPDLRLAEQQLIAANARVGVAKAAFFPSINLSAGAGIQSVDLLGIVVRDGFGYGMGGTIDLPIFDAGRRKGNYNTSQAVKQELVINYQKAIQNAFRDVSNSLIGYQKAKEYRANQTLFTETLRDQSIMANIRYRGGVSNYIEVLDTERQLLSAELQFSQAKRDELVSLVQLYKALGGGWQLQ